MEDGAPGHKGYTTFSREINSLPWPPQSPDLNLIEALWGGLECELGEKYWRLVDVNILEEKIQQGRLLGLVKGMRKRLEYVIY